MLTWSQLDGALLSMSAHVGEHGRLDAAWRAWLDVLPARDLVRLQWAARRSGWRYPAALPRSSEWVHQHIRDDVGVAALAAMHYDGRLRERGVDALAERSDALATKVLAMAAHDHVAAIRDRARRELLRRTSSGTAMAVMPVVLAMRDIKHGRGLIEAYLRARDADPAGFRDDELVPSVDRNTRLWVYRRAIARAHEADRLVVWLEAEKDQMARGVLARHLVVSAPTAVEWLIGSRRVDDRVLALWHLPDEAVAPDLVELSLTSASARIRQAARWRFRRLGQEPKDFYRSRLAIMADDSKVLAETVAGAREVGEFASSAQLARWLEDSRPAVRSEVLRSWREPGPSTDVLLAKVMDASPAVAKRAASALVGRSTSYADLDAAASSESVVSRRVALRVRRDRGDWSRVRADLEVVRDTELRGEALADLHAWIHDRSATAYSVPQGEDRSEILRLLDELELDRELERRLRFCVGRVD